MTGVAVANCSRDYSAAFHVVMLDGQWLGDHTLSIAGYRFRKVPKTLWIGSTTFERIKARSVNRAERRWRFWFRRVEKT